MTCTNYANNPKADAAMPQNRKRPADEGYARAHKRTARHSHQHTRAPKDMSGKSGKHVKREGKGFLTSRTLEAFSLKKWKSFEGWSSFANPTSQRLGPWTTTAAHNNTHGHTYTHTHYDRIALHFLCRGWRCAKARAFAACYTRSAEQNRWHDDNLH